MLDAATATRNPAAQLATGGPLFAIAAAMRARLEAVFPPTRFQHGWLPIAPTREEWKRLVQRTPYVGLTWTGAPTAPNSGRLPRLRSTWRVLVVNSHSDVAGRFLGDRFGPGQFGLVQVAAAALHGWTVAGDDVPGAGTAEVSDIANLSTDGWADAAEAIAGLTVGIDFTLVDAHALPDLTTLAASWQIDQAESDLLDAGENDDFRLDLSRLDLNPLG